MDVKKCGKCGVEKPIEDFPNRKTARGEIKKNGMCRECISIKAMEYRKLNQEYFKQYGKEYKEKNKEKLKLIDVAWRKENKEKIIKDSKKYHEKNRERNNKKNREYQKNNYDSLRDWRLRYTFGVTLSDFKLLSEQQNGVCAICHRPETALRSKGSDEIRSLALDHDHVTGKVRGLLCQKCNKGLGFFEDSLDNLRVAIEYLNKANKS